MKKYYSKIDTWISVTLLLSIIAIWFPLIKVWNEDSMVLSISMTVLIGACTWLITNVMINTYYWFDGDKIHWRTGPFRGQLEINEIKKVTRAQSFMDISGVIKPCLTSKPLLLRYGTYEDLPISPKEEAEFIEQLKSLHSELEVSLS